MGVYFNPGNESFKRARNSQIFVDKTGLIEYLNKRLSTEENCIALSHARRFGKSHAAGMIDAYYSLGCDSTKLFEDTEIAKSSDFKKYMNKYNVIHLDISSVWDFHKEDLVESIHERVCEDFQKEYADTLNYDKALYLLIREIYNKTNIPFVIIIDEWDCILREKKEDTTSFETYLDYLRTLFKDQPYVALAYMTGILPIKKYGTQSALNMFREYSMTNPNMFEEYVGFTETEVLELCSEYKMDLEEMMNWYDGYSFETVPHVYNPKSVVEAIIRKQFGSYWTRTETYEALKCYIDMNLNGLKDAITCMLGGETIKIDPETFQNDMTTFETKDDVLTLLVHLGYLAFDKKTSSVFIPNREVRGEFVRAINGVNWASVAKAIEDSEKLLKATLAMDEKAVEEMLDIAFMKGCSPTIICESAGTQAEDAKAMMDYWKEKEAL